MRLNDVHPIERRASDQKDKGLHARLDNIDNVLHGKRLAGFGAVQWAIPLCFMEQSNGDRRAFAFRDNRWHLRIADWIIKFGFHLLPPVNFKIGSVLSKVFFETRRGVRPKQQQTPLLRFGRSRGVRLVSAENEHRK